MWSWCVFVSIWLGHVVYVDTRTFKVCGYLYFQGVRVPAYSTYLYVIMIRGPATVPNGTPKGHLTPPYPAKTSVICLSKAERLCAKPLPPKRGKCCLIRLVSPPPPACQSISDLSPPPPTTVKAHKTSKNPPSSAQPAWI